MTSRLNIVLAVLLVVVATLTVALRPDPTRPNVEFMPDMKYSPAPLAYAPSPVVADGRYVFANGRTLQAPVAGTIPRGAMPLHYSATKEDAVRAGEELMNPYQKALTAEVGLAALAASTEENAEASTDNSARAANVETVASVDPVEIAPTARERLQTSVRRGGETYRVYCITCHGPTGDGDGPVPKRGFPPPPSLLTGNSRMMKDGQLFHILTYGQGNMPQFAAQLSRDARWDMINYIRDMQPPIDESAPAAEGSEATRASAESAAEPTVVPESGDNDPEADVSDDSSSEAETVGADAVDEEAK